jgi:hypothetical protein
MDYTNFFIPCQRVSDNIYKCEYGYFINRKNKEWTFTPLEKDMNVDILMTIMDTLRNLNEL